MDDVVLQVTGIRKTFPGVLALDNISFDLRRGEVHALIGENGAGKSTLMKILSGVEKPDEGKLVLRGKPVVFHDATEARKAGIGIIFQELNLIPDLTVAQNIFIGREPGTPWGTIDEKKMIDDAAALLATLHQTISPMTTVRRLTISQQQMVEITKALSQKSDVLIMDEPTSALTESEIPELFRVIRHLRDDGVGIIYITHRLDELKHVADRVSIFRDGRHVGTDVYGEIDLKEIVNRMVGRKLELQFPARKNVPTSEVILDVRGLSAGNRVKGVSFQLYRGEILGFAGLMGAGRSETARAIFGADPKTEGTISLGGKEVVIRSPDEAIGMGIAYLPEDRKRHGLAVAMSVVENLTMANISAISRAWGILSRAEENKAGKKIHGKPTNQDAQS